ncbi:hypothetical protein C0584_01325 [Candidatus Parcubacteria bacterium]|nr:MAG: hypothetical protein C0584_01325 [Candidatus Parcubacteria bacterium]
MKVAVEEWELYNNGILLCRWFDTETDTQEEIAAFVAEAKTAYKLNSNDLEMFIADVEDDATGLIKGDESLCYAYEVTQKIIDLEEHERTALKLMLQNGVVNDLDEAIEHLEDIRCTGERKMEDVAYNYIQETGAISALGERLQGYFDYEALGRDMEINGTYLEDEEGILWEYVS